MIKIKQINIPEVLAISKICTFSAYGREHGTSLVLSLRL